MTKTLILKILKIAGIAVAVAVLVVGIALLCNVVRKFYLYNKAINLLSDESFSEAYEIFDELHDYKESREYKKKCEYQHAIRLLKRGKYEEGYAKLEKLGSYNDSDDYKNKHIYNRAVGFLNSGSYKKAEELFSRIKNFDDSSELLKECRYQLAYEYFSHGNVEEAHKIYVQLGDYKDSATRAATKHYFKPGKVTKMASCSEVGSMEYNCSCGASEVREIAKKSHIYKSATCTEPRICQFCGEKLGEPLDHIYLYMDCMRCGENLFTGKTYTGGGSNTIDLEYLPIDEYKFTLSVTVPAGESTTITAIVSDLYGEKKRLTCTADATGSTAKVKKSVTGTAEFIASLRSVRIEVPNNECPEWELLIELV